MNIVSAQQFVNDQLLPVHQAEIPTTLRTAYAAAELLWKAEPILQVTSAVDNRGRLIQWAVDLAFQRLIETGKWAFDYNWKSYARPTGRYLRIKMPHSVMTISQVEDPEKQPRNVVFRANGRMKNQFVLFDDETEREAREVKGLPHFLLLHGYQSLRFAHVTVPHENHRDGFIYRSQNLMLTPHEVPAPFPPAENTDHEAILSLKEEIEKWQKDHGE